MPRAVAADDDAAALHRPDHALCDWRSYREHAVGVLAKLGEFLFVHRLCDDEPSACCLHSPALLLDIRKSVIGDDDFHVSSPVDGSTKSFAHKFLRPKASPLI
jgi:hypothetical protein